METVVVRHASLAEIEGDELRSWLKSAVDGDLFDMDVLSHGSSFVLCAVGSRSKRMAYLPMQRPLMMENLITSPWLSPTLKTMAVCRLVEEAMAEAYRVDAGEVYFLSRHGETAEFAKKRGFKDLQEVDPELRVYRLNLLETFGPRD